MNKFFKWLENIWNLRLIFDKYIPKIKEIIATLHILQMQLEDLRQAKFELEKELKRIKEEQQGVEIPVTEEPKATKEEKHYDPQMDVEYYSFEINGDNEDTERE